jgi:hypothetical protein
MVMEYVYEIVVTPDGGSTGQNLIKVLNSLNALSRLPAVVVADVECNGDRSWVQKVPFTTTTLEVIDYAGSVGQFDWATFFFFPRPPSDNTENQQYNVLFAAAEMVVRAVDDTYFYVYSPVEDDSSRLGQFFTVECQRKHKDAIVHPF